MSVKVIAYDVGTTGLKTCMFSISAKKSIEFLDSEVESYSLTVLGNGAVEQDPAQWWQAMSLSTKRLLQRTGTLAGEIKGISFCSQMQNVIMVDEKGHPLRPEISWMDTRANEQFSRYMRTGIRVEGLDIFKVLKFIRITGVVSAGSKDPAWKYLWVRDNEPEIFKATYKWLDAKEYLNCRATGVMKASRDIAASTFLYDVKKGIWSKKLCDMLGVDMRHLPELCESTDIVGELRPDAAKELGLTVGTPVFSGGSDVSLCQIGAGCMEPGQVNVYSGTSGWVGITVGRLKLDLKNIIGALVGADPTVYNYIAEIDTSGKCMEWVKDRIDLPLSDYNELEKYIAGVPAGSNDVIFSPWMHGNRCPFEDADARGMFFNLDLSTRGGDLVKSVIEGVCMHFRWLLDATEESFKTHPVIRFTGGSAISPTICQTLADVLGREIETIENPRLVGVMGAVGLMAVGFNMISDIKDIEKIIRVQATYKPNQENTAVYDRIFPVFKMLYSNNKKAYSMLNKQASAKKTMKSDVTTPAKGVAIEEKHGA